jgi:hypothetical protein
MRIEFLDPAKRELAEAIAYYVYQPSEDVIFVAAVMHLHRHPDSWKARLPSP